MDLTKRFLKQLLNVKTDAELARFFDISRAAVGQWGGEDSAIPPGRGWEVMARRPDLFRKQRPKT